MTVTTTANSITYAGNGTTTAFAFPYIFFAPGDLVVTLIVTATSVAIVPAPVLNGAATYDYTVTGDVSDGEYASGATVTFNTAPLATHTVSLVRYVPPTQLVTLIDNTKFPAATINSEFDKLTVLAQQNSAVVGSNPIGPAGGMLAGVYPNPTIAPGSNGQVMSTVGGVALWAAPAAALIVLQTVSFQTGAMATGSTIIPGDDTIPQITEGDQYMTLAITRQSATSKLIIDVVWNGSVNASPGQMIVALFQDSTANALAATTVNPAAVNSLMNIRFTHTMASGATGATTFRVRAGASVAGPTTFNGVGGARLLGGVMASSIVIQEVAP